MWCRLAEDHLEKFKKMRHVKYRARAALAVALLGALAACDSTAPVVGGNDATPDANKDATEVGRI